MDNNDRELFNHVYIIGDISTYSGLYNDFEVKQNYYINNIFIYIISNIIHSS